MQIKACYGNDLSYGGDTYVTVVTNLSQRELEITQFFIWNLSNNCIYQLCDIAVTTSLSRMSLP